MVYGKEISRSLIRYFKKIDLGGCYTDKSHRAIFELARQLSGPQMRKMNPKLALDLQFLEPNQQSYIKAEFITGEKLEIDPISQTCQELREELFWTAEGVEMELDKAGNNPIVGEDEDDATDAKTTKKK